MAKPAKPEADEASAPAPKKSKKLFIIIGAALVLILAIGGGAAYFLMKSSSTEGEEGDEEEVVVEKAKPAAKKKEKAKETDPVFTPMDAFVVNLGTENGGPFLQLILSLEVDDAATGEAIKKATPKLRNSIILLLSGKKADELLSRDGKLALAKEIRSLMNEALEPSGKGKEGPVRDVLFTSFIIQ